MTPGQAWALTNIIETQEQLGEIWSKPRRFNMPGISSREVLITMCVAADGDKLIWTAGVRIRNIKKGHLKKTSLWTAYERLKATEILTSELSGVGVEFSDEVFATSTGLHLNRHLTSEELGHALKPNILGN